MRRVLLVAAIVAAPLGVVGLQAARAWRKSHRDFDNVPLKFEAPAPVEGLEALKLKTRGGLTIAASFVPAKNGVAVILAHGTDASRVQTWPEVRALAAAGFGALAFDWPGHGESEGEIRLGTPEREAFTACVDFLSARPEVQRIGAYGFSNGGGLLTAFVADEPRVKSLLAVGAWSDAIEQIGYEFRRWGPIRSWPAMAAARQHVEGGDLRSLDFAPKLKGRKTMFVAGAEDEIVLPQMSVDLANAAQGRSKVIPGAHHLDFREVLPEWNALLTGFFASETP